MTIQDRTQVCPLGPIPWPIPRRCTDPETSGLRSHFAAGLKIAASHDSLDRAGNPAMAYNEYLVERVRAGLKRHRVPTEEKAMMGGICFMVRGKMCVGVDKDRLMVRLDPERQAEALARPGAAPMDFTGRPLRGFVFVSAEGWERSDDLTAWLALALDYNPRAKAAKKKARPRPVPPDRTKSARDRKP